MKETKAKGVKGFLLRSAMPVANLVIKRGGKVILKSILSVEQELQILKQFGSNSKSSSVLRLTPKMVENLGLPIQIKKKYTYELHREIDKGFFFRVYKGHRKFNDYDIWHFDLEVQIIDKFAVFRGKTLDYSARVLGR